MRIYHCHFSANTTQGTNAVSSGRYGIMNSLVILRQALSWKQLKSDHLGHFCWSGKAYRYYRFPPYIHKARQLIPRPREKNDAIPRPLATGVKMRDNVRLVSLRPVRPTKPSGLLTLTVKPVLRIAHTCVSNSGVPLIIGGEGRLLDLNNFSCSRIYEIWCGDSGRGP